MKATLLTATEEIRLAGASHYVTLARECLEYLGLNGKLMQSLHKISFDRPQTLQINDGKQCVSFVATSHEGLKLFFIVVNNRFYLPGILVDGSEVIETSLFQKTEFVAKPDTSLLINLIKKI